MDITETVIFRNIPREKTKIIELLSSAYNDINPELMLNEIDIIFKGGTTSKEIRSTKS